MKLFRNMSQSEVVNWKKGAVLGFYTYMLLLFINQTYSLFSVREPLSSTFVFWTGLLVAFGYQYLLDLRAKRKDK
ncbi:hypothetical protein QGM71_10515 [Virgibacillus sp. C22-A2]|uniref:Uncharacterized protein n=1 Tax=Virgibacillus tibetensis TaxID=3042313 RepID=A0ABU6KF31_9BACI|nr:hypothetical protein [Virgibacillus sp. C22-A2]